MGRLSQAISRLAAEAIVVAENIHKEYKLKKANSLFLKNRVIFWFFLANFLTVFFNFFYIYLSLQTKEGLIPLHYNIYFGVDLLGSKDQIFKLPFVALFVLIINYFLAKTIYEQEKYLSYILVNVSLLVAVILFSAAIFILNI